jgi:hypothetical protein
MSLEELVGSMVVTSAMGTDFYAPYIRDLIVNKDIRDLIVNKDFSSQACVMMDISAESIEGFMLSRNSTAHTEGSEPSFFSEYWLPCEDNVCDVCDVCDVREPSEPSFELDLLSSSASAESDEENDGELYIEEESDVEEY